MVECIESKGVRIMTSEKNQLSPLSQKAVKLGNSWAEPNSGVQKGKSKATIRAGLEEAFCGVIVKRLGGLPIMGVTTQRAHATQHMCERIVKRTHADEPRAGTHAAWCVEHDTLSHSFGSRRKAISMLYLSHVWCKSCKKIHPENQA
tara:strand:+ start:1403 stop:1843 length:441 start_codon:yes stop_codon:yes gene_type:complete